MTETQGFPLSFYITDHSAKKRGTGSPDRLRILYHNLRQDGIGSVRYDFDWDHIEPEPGRYDIDQLTRYSRAKTIMAQAGLAVPTIILSNPPKWAKKLYKAGKRTHFFSAYEEYLDQVKIALYIAGGEPVQIVQILNELNNPSYNFVNVVDLPRLCTITRDAFRFYNPRLKLLASVVASNTIRLIRGTPVMEYLSEFKKIKSYFDVIAVDWYPAVWHFAGQGSALDVRDVIKRTLDDDHHPQFFKDMVRNTELLEACLREVATWGMEYEIGEVGMRTNPAYGGGEKTQRYFFDAFARSLKHLLLKFREESIEPPLRVGLYEALDEPPEGSIKKFLSEKTIWPEHNIGVRRANGQPKLILKGRLRKGVPVRGGEQPSQLTKIISYTRAPMDKSSNT